jgi:ethanolamine utilization protein EutN
MIAARVIDSIWSTRKVDRLVGIKFMLAEVLGGTDAGRLVIAADLINAGIGERVIISQGSSARQIFDNDNVPIDAVIIGIIDAECTF